MELCPFCHNAVELIPVAGHVQCPICTQVVEGCCTGESIWHEGENVLESVART